MTGVPIHEFSRGSFVCKKDQVCFCCIVLSVWHVSRLFCMQTCANTPELAWEPVKVSGNCGPFALTFILSLNRLNLGHVFTWFTDNRLHGKNGRRVLKPTIESWMWWIQTDMLGVSPGIPFWDCRNLTFVPKSYFSNNKKNNNMNFKYLCSAKMLVWLKGKKDETQLSEGTAHLTLRQGFQSTHCILYTVGTPFLKVEI